MKFLFATLDKRGKSLSNLLHHLRMTSLAETIVHVSAELPIGFFKELHLWKALFNSLNLPCG